MEPQIDFRWRGGMLMMRRRIFPWRQASSLAAINSICQFGEKFRIRIELQETALNESIKVLAQQRLDIQPA